MGSWGSCPSRQTAYLRFTTQNEISTGINTHSRILVGRLWYTMREKMMWMISFIFIVAYSRSIGRFSSWNWIQVPIERIIFISAFLSFVRCLDVGDMFGQDVNVSSGAKVHAAQRTFRYNIYDQTWDLSTPSLVRSLSHDPCLRITNLLSIFLTTRKVIFWYASFPTPLSL